MIGLKSLNLTVLKSWPGSELGACRLTVTFAAIENNAIPVDG